MHTRILVHTQGHLLIKMKPGVFCKTYTPTSSDQESFKMLVDEPTSGRTAESGRETFLAIAGFDLNTE
jgi:hypothetical protein